MARGPRSRPLYPIAATVSTLAALVSMAALPALVDVPFSPAQIAAGTAALAASQGLAFFGAALMIYRGWAFVADPASHMLHALSRWVDLCRQDADIEDGSGPRAPSPLIGHVARDPDCTCPSSSCAGQLPGRVATYFLAESAIRISLVAFTIPIFSCWTPMVTYGSIWFTTWWSALLGVVNIASHVVTLYAICGQLFRSPNPPMVELSRRLQRRAMGRALTALLDRYRGLLLGVRPDNTGGNPDKGGISDSRPLPVSDPGELTSSLMDSEPYAQLFLQLAADWSRDRQARGFSTVAFFISSSLLGCVAGGIANVVAGSCIPAWQIAYIAWWIFYHMVYITSLAAANARITSVRKLLLQARIRVEALLVAAAESESLHAPSQHRTAIHVALACHADRLRTFSSAGDPARFLGIEVSFGTARAFLVTSLTVGFAAYGLLRGLGVSVVLSSYCGA